jgi:hypothetical protein
MMKIENDLINDVIRATNRMNCWMQQRQHFLPVVDEPYLQNVRFSWTGSELYIGASGGKEELETIFHCLALHGFRLPAEAKRPAENQPEWTGNFYKTVKDPIEGLPTTQYRIYVSFTSLYCQRQQVGTEMREVPIFKIICGDTPIEPTDTEIPF